MHKTYKVCLSVPIPPIKPKINFTDGATGFIGHKITVNKKRKQLISVKELETIVSSCVFVASTPFFWAKMLHHKH